MSSPNTQKQPNRPKPVVLIVLDGWGIAQPYSGNAISQANTPTIDRLIAEYPSMALGAAGEAVGVPWGESGNSEVGHINLGLGRVLYQDLPKINKTINDGSFYKNEVLLKTAEHVKKNKSKLHLIGMVSNGCVHSSIEHLEALLAFAKEQHIDQVYAHAILDGRDTPYNSGINFIRDLERFMAEYKIGKIATISGRFYAMDRNNHWDRIEKAYMAMVEGNGNKSNDPIKAIEESYKKKIYDEEFEPIVITSPPAPLLNEERVAKPVAKIEEGDAVIFFNYRADRARQLTKAFVLPSFNKFDNSRKSAPSAVFFACFTEYEKNLPVNIVFPVEEITNTLGEIISKAGLKQLRIAETEKYAHVTYFFNGGNETALEGETHELAPSPQVASYDLKPEMSALELTDKVIKEIDKNEFDFILINFANADMVGHTGNLQATIRACEIVDKCVEKLVKNVLEKNGYVLITADHGNAETVFNMQTGTIDKEHTANPVPFIIISKELEGRKIGGYDTLGSDLSLIQPQGILSDVAPTILKILGIEKPKEMTGRSVI